MGTLGACHDYNHGEAKEEQELVSLVAVHLLPSLYNFSFGSRCRCMALLDLFVTPSISRVLFTLRSTWQIMYVTFYVLLAGWQTPT